MPSLDELLATMVAESSVSFVPFRGGGTAEVDVPDSLEVPSEPDLPPLKPPAEPGLVPVDTFLRATMHLSEDVDGPAVAETHVRAAGGTAATQLTLRAKVAAPVDIRPASPGSLRDAPAWVFAHVRATALGFLAERTFGPYRIAQPAVAVPTVAMTFTRAGVESDSEQQLAYVMVHPSTPLDEDLGRLVDAFSKIATDLGDLAATLPVALDLEGFAQITKLLESRAGGTIQVRDKQGNLNDIEAEDSASAVYVIGPPGTAVDFFTQRDYDTGEGTFRVTTGDGWLASLPDLSQGLRPTVEHGSFDLLHEPDGDPHFNNRISSLAFVE